MELIFPQLAATLLALPAWFQPVPQGPSPMVDTTRPHPRVERQEVAGKRFPLSVGTLYLSANARARSRIPLLVHFHGAPWLVEYHVARHAPQAALVTVHLGAGSQIYSETFSDPSRFSTLLTEARERVRQATGRDAEWGNVTLTSFSAGYGAIRSILKHPSHYALIDAILLADSLHAAYLSEGVAQDLPESQADRPRKLDSESLEPFGHFAEDTARGNKGMWVTHSEVYPGTYASTTETADFLLERLRVRRRPVLRRGPVGMQQLSEVSVGKFYLAGFAGNSAPDHMDHLYALGDWLQRMRATSQSTGIFALPRKTRPKSVLKKRAV